MGTPAKLYLVRDLHNNTELFMGSDGSVLEQIYYGRAAQFRNDRLMEDLIIQEYGISKFTEAYGAVEEYEDCPTFEVIY